LAQQVANRPREFSGDADIVARSAADHAAQAARRARDLAALLAENCRFDGRDYVLDIGTGMALFPAGAARLDVVSQDVVHLKPEP
jgi:tRNA1(Val) A37 N6-methylase TrmN6